MYILKACLVCYSSDVKLFSLNKGQLRYDFQQISGIQINHCDGMPNYLCFQCSAMVGKFKKFRDKCHRAHFALNNILTKNHQISINHLKNFNRDCIDIKPPLSYMTLDKTHYEEVKFQWTKPNRINSCVTLTPTHIPMLCFSTLDASVLDTFNGVCNLNTKDLEYTEKNIKTDLEIDTPTNETNIAIPIEIETKDDCTNRNETTVNLTIDNIAESYMDIDDYGSEIDQDDSFDNLPCKLDNQGGVDGADTDVEYATVVPISATEAKAAIEVYKLFSQGKHRCEVCQKGYHNEKRLQIHKRMHNQHVSGGYLCGLCQFYYKTEFLLKSHMTEKHMYKYICRKCPEVNFDRTSAKQHYIWTHLQKGDRNGSNWYDSRPTWMNARGGKRVKGVVRLRPVKKLNQLPGDFLTCAPIEHKEQYTLIQDRQKSRNYQDAQYKCNFCYRGFRLLLTYNKHLKKHSAEYSGKLQCDMCKLYFKDHRKMYKHMNGTHLYKYSCQLCSYVCYNRGQAQMHYRWHKNVTYECPHCKKTFMKASTRLTHIRIKHPSMYLCNLCGHSYVSETGLYCHKKMTHTKEEIELSNNMEINTSDQYYCADCNLQFLNEEAFSTHLGSSYKHSATNVSIKPGRKGKREDERRSRGRPPARQRDGRSSEIINNGVTTSTTCEVCGKFLPNDVQARKHYEAVHPDTEYLKRYMCDVCGHTTRQYANLLVHMRTHTDEKPYGCPHCDRRFNMPSNRDRHLVVHTGEKRYQCQHCNRRFTQSSAVKLHIQTVHLKIPYPPWNKKNRKRRKELEAAGISAPSIPPQSTHKLAYETPGDYLNAFITYNDD